MKNIIRYAIVVLSGLSCLIFGCPCPFTPISAFEVWTVYPEDGAMIYEPEVELIWSYSTGHGVECANLYFVYVGTSPGNLIAVGQTVLDDTNFVLTSLEPSTTYYWMVKATYYVYEHGEQEFSNIASFTTVDEFWEPGYPHSPYPDSGATNIDSILTMYWSCYNPDEEDFDSDVYLGTTTDPPLVDIGLTDTTRSLDTLAGSTTYYWKVVSYNETDTVEGNLWQFTTRYPAGIEMFTLLEVDALQAPSGYHVQENIRARFDTAYAAQAPIHPLQADSVFCENVRLNWNATDQNYSYTEFSMPFIENGQPFDFTVYGNAEVPYLNTGTVFPACTLAVISPESFETVSIDGFEVTWDGFGCGEDIWITLLAGTDSTGVMKLTDNDGIDTLTTADLAPLGGQSGTYNLVIFKEIQQGINASGYMPSSFIRTRAINVMEQINIL